MNNQNKVHFGLAISKELDEKLKSLADADKRSKSAYVRIVLEEHIKAVNHADGNDLHKTLINLTRNG